MYIYIYIKMSKSTKRFEFFLGLDYLFSSYMHVCFQLVTFVKEHVWHKAFLMRSELICVCSLNSFHLVMD